MAHNYIDVQLELAYWHIKEQCKSAVILRKDTILRKIWVYAPSTKVQKICLQEKVLIIPSRWYFTPYSYKKIVYIPRTKQ